MCGYYAWIKNERNLLGNYNQILLKTIKKYFMPKEQNTVIKEFISNHKEKKEFLLISTLFIAITSS